MSKKAIESGGLTYKCPCCGANQNDITVSDPIAVGGSVYQEAHCKRCGEVADARDFVEAANIEVATEEAREEKRET